MFEKDGQKYFVVDGHVHFWDARPENRNRYGEGFIKCFYDYHRNLSPAEYVWSLEEYERYPQERMVRDLFEVGYADKAIFQPTYLIDFFPGGFNTTEQDAQVAVALSAGDLRSRETDVAAKHLGERPSRRGVEPVPPPVHRELKIHLHLRSPPRRYPL